MHKWQLNIDRTDNVVTDKYFGKKSWAGVARISGCRLWTWQGCRQITTHVRECECRGGLDGGWGGSSIWNHCGHVLRCFRYSTHTHTRTHTHTHEHTRTCEAFLSPFVGKLEPVSIKLPPFSCSQLAFFSTPVSLNYASALISPLHHGSQKICLDSLYNIFPSEDMRTAELWS